MNHVFCLEFCNVFFSRPESIIFFGLIGIIPFFKGKEKPQVWREKLQYHLHPYHIKWLPEFSPCIMQSAHFGKTKTQVKPDARFVF